VLAGTTPVGTRGDSFCLSDQALPKAESQGEGTSLRSIAEMHLGSFETESSSDTICKDLASFFTSSDSAHFSPFRGEARPDALGSATPKALTDMLSSSERFCLGNQEMPRGAPTTTHFVPFSEDCLCLDSATPKALADMAIEVCALEDFCLATSGTAGASFAPFRFDDAMADRGTATPKALAQQYSTQSSSARFCSGQDDTGAANFMPFPGEASFHDQGTATPKSSADW